MSLQPEQVRDLESRLRAEVARAEQAEKTNVQLQDELQVTCDLTRSKDQLLDLSQAEVRQLRESLSQASAEHQEQTTR